MRAPQYANLSTKLKVKEVFKDMGKNMWKSGSGFARVGALYAGSECVIEGVSLSYIPLYPHDPTRLSPRLPHPRIDLLRVSDVVTNDIQKTH